MRVTLLINMTQIRLLVGLLSAT